MKTNHTNLILIQDWLEVNNLQIEMSDDFVRRVYDEVLENRFLLKDKESIKHRNRAYKLQYDFVRRDLLKIQYIRNGFSAKGIKAGYVYAIGNPAWTDFVKIGSAVDVIDRLGSYQTSSPLRDFYIIDYFCTYDRLAYEKKIHSMFDRNSEWCKIDEAGIRVIFKRLKAENNIPVLNEKLHQVKNLIAATNLVTEKLKEEKKVIKKTLRQEFTMRNRIHTNLYSPSVDLPEIDY